jgi:predicted transposase YdaD
MLGDFLRDSPVYQEVLEEGAEKGRLEAQRQILFDIVFERFPEIIRLARQQANAVDDTEILHRLTVKMSTVQNAEEYLLTATGDTLKN